MGQKYSYVYAIQHNKTQKIYVGSTGNVDQRYVQHMTQLRNDQHGVEDMQNDFNLFGEDYSLFVLEKVLNGRTNINDLGNSLTNAHLAEYQWIEKLGTYKRQVGYNYKDIAAIKRIERGFKNDIPYKKGIPIPKE